MFMGDFEAEKPWDTRTVDGVTRFLQKCWRVMDSPVLLDDPHGRLRHKTIQAVTERLESFKFNTAISALMEYVNALSGGAGVDDREVLCRLLSPMAPHLAEEMWERLGKKGFVCCDVWPKFNPTFLVDEITEYPIQINGKLRERLVVRADSDEKTVVALAKALPRVQSFLVGQRIIKEVFVSKRMVSFLTTSGMEEKR